jgi:HEAT repeat protein
LNTLREWIKDPDEETRHRAVQGLGQHGEEALPLLHETLGDRSWRVRKASLEEVVGIPGQRRVGVLLDGLRDEENVGRRNTCIEALIRLGGEVVPHLSTLLEDSDSDLRKFGVDILGNIEDESVLKLLLSALEDGDENVSAAAAEYLGKKECREAAAPLIRRLEGGGYWLKYSCLRALGEIGDESAGPAVLAHAKGRDLQMVCLEVLGKIGVTEAIPLLLEGLFSEDRGLRRVALLGAARLGRRLEESGRGAGALWEGIRKNSNPDLIVFLQEMIQHEDSGLRTAAMKILGEAAGREAVDPLLEILSKAGEEEQEFIVGILQTLPEKDLPVLFPKLRVEDTAVRRRVVQVLGSRSCRGAVPHLLALLEDPDGHVQREAARALGDIGDQVAVAPLIAFLGHSFPDVRLAGVDALIKLGQHGEEAQHLVLKLLESHLDSDDQEMVANALRVIARLGSRQVMERLSLSIKDERSQVRCAAVEAVGSIGGAEAVPVLRLVLTDEDAMVRREVVTHLGRIRSPEVVPLLVPMIQDEDLWVRVRVLQSFAGVEHREAKEILLERARQGPVGPERLTAIRALGQGKVLEGLETLISLAAASEREVRMAAIEALGELEREEAVDVLISSLQEKDLTLRAAAVKALGRFVGQDRVHGVLAEIAQTDRDPSVRKDVANLLGTRPH